MLALKKIIIGLLLALSILQLQCAEFEKIVFGCRGDGFFAEFNPTLNHLDWSLKNNKKPVIYWGQRFSYFAPEGFHGQTNGWEYYFHQTSDECYHKGDTITHEGWHKARYHKTADNFSAMWTYSQFIVNLPLLPDEERAKCINITKFDYFKMYERHPIKFPVGKKHLYDPEHRAYVKSEIIDRYIRLQPWVAEKINKFYKAHMQGHKVIGIHLRGKFLGPGVATVPFDVIFETANKLSDDNCLFFIATDQQPLLKQAQQKLNGKVIFYETQRYEKTTSPTQKARLHPKMGEDVVIEMLLLAHCDHLVHTLSNVSIAALYFNPTMNHTLLY